VSALALSVVASIDCMVTAVVADAATSERHNSGRELVAQGLGQILAGLLGGSGGGGTKGSTLTAIHSGGRRWPAVVAALGIVALVFLVRPVGEFLPISVLAGIVIHVGLQMVDWRIISWMRSRKARIDGILALIVVAATLAFSVMTGVGVGAIGAAMLFIRSQSATTAIGQKVTGKERRSLRHRSEEEKKLLDAHGDRILYVELRGHLFFGTVDRLFTELFDELKRPAWIVINMRRVQSLDMSGLNLLRQMTSINAAHGGHMLFANVYPGVAPDRKISKGLRLLDPTDRSLKAKTFKNADKALQHAEDRLLFELTGQFPSGPSRSVRVEDNALCRSMRPKLRSVLTGILRPVTLHAKDRVFTAGDEDSALYLVLEGEVDVRVASDKYHYKRLNRIGPGGFFGEISFLNPGPRVTTAVALGDVQLMALDRGTVESASDPSAKRAIESLQRELAHELAARLRWTTSEIRRLEKG
jgi:SulP family sulfate permease